MACGHCGANPTLEEPLVDIEVSGPGVRTAQGSHAPAVKHTSLRHSRGEPFLQGDQCTSELPIIGGGYATTTMRLPPISVVYS